MIVPVAGVARLFDVRLRWVARHCLYKPFAGRLQGIGYLGKPSFVWGFRHFFSASGLGIFPGWRIEITGGEVCVGKNVRIGNNLVLNCGSSIEIGDEVTISANVFVGTTDSRPSAELSETFKSWPVVERPVRIGRGCFIGFGAVILPGTILGQGCVVGANAVVRGEFPAGSVIAAERACIIRSRI